MKRFEIVIDLVVTCPTIADVHLAIVKAGIVYGNLYIDALSGARWDITLDHYAEAETAKEAAATLSDKDRKSFGKVDPDWHGFVFHDDDEVMEVGADGDTYCMKNSV